jgi:site-specific DNA-methyltransferase (adenine-specific)
MNPPYGREIGQWVKKAYNESRNGATVVCLLPARTDTAWWHDYVLPMATVTFIRGRLKFGDSKNSAPFPSAVAVFYPPKVAR